MNGKPVRTAVFSRMENLKEPDPGHARITSAGLPELAKLQHLEKLNLWMTRIRGDAGGLAALEKLPRLQRLEVDETLIDDTAIDALKSLPGLNDTELWYRDITSAGVAALRAARPDLTVRCELRR